MKFNPSGLEFQPDFDRFRFKVNQAGEVTLNGEPLNPEP